MGMLAGVATLASTTVAAAAPDNTVIGWQLWNNIEASLTGLFAGANFKSRRRPVLVHISFAGRRAIIEWLSAERRFVNQMRIGEDNYALGIEGPFGVPLLPVAGVDGEAIHPRYHRVLVF